MTNEKLIILIRSGADQEKNMQMLCKQNRDYIFKLTVPYLTGEVLAEDLIQAGMKGLRTAAEKYDPGAGVPFLTFATWWIRDSIKRFSQNKPQRRSGKVAAAPDLEEAAAPAVSEQGLNNYEKQVKQMLQQLRKAAQHINTLKNQLADLEDIRLSPVVFDGGGRSSVTSDFTGNLAIRIATMKNRIAKETLHYLDLLQEADSLIDDLPDAMCRIILHDRYILGDSWEEISKDLGYSDKNCYVLHVKAIKALADHINENSCHICPRSSGIDSEEG